MYLYAPAMRGVFSNRFYPRIRVWRYSCQGLPVVNVELHFTRCKSVIRILCFFIVLMSSYNVTASHGVEEYYSTPGTRAQGMAGNFVALATDSSAVWYNPAGLGFNTGHIDMTLEYGDYVAFDGDTLDEGQLGSAKHLKFAAVAIGPVGIAYFRPYVFSSNSYAAFNTFLVETSYTELKIAFGFKPFPAVALGASLDKATMDSNSVCASCDGDTRGSDIGLSVGGLLKHRLENGIEWRLGTTLRSSLEVEPGDGGYQDLPIRPSSRAAGAALGLPLKGTYLLVTVQTETIKYNEQHVSEEFTGAVANTVTPEYSRRGIGAEWTVYPDPNVTWMLRVGFAKTQTDLAGTEVLHDDIRALSWGLGLVLENGLVFDFAYESRNLTNSSNANATQDIKLNSFSLSRSF